MAVLDFLPGITAQILINGVPATEIHDPDEIQGNHDNPVIANLQAVRTVSKYIQSETGKYFQIKVRVEPPYQIDCSKLGFHIYVDGKPAWTPYCERVWFTNKGHQNWERKVNGIKEGKGRGCTEKNFCFAKIVTNSHQLELPAKRRLAERLMPVGLIEIKVYRENYGRRWGPTEASSNGFLAKQGAYVPEDALKGDAKSHGTALGNAHKTARGDVWRAKKIDGEDRPIVIFRFMYRSKQDLKQMHIIEHTPSPSPSPARASSVATTNYGPDGLTDAQRQAVSQLLASFKSQKMRNGMVIKRERDDNEERGRSTTRGGRSRPAKRRRPGAPPEVIILDDDDDKELFVSPE